MISLEQFKQKLVVTPQNAGFKPFLEQSEVWMRHLMADHGSAPRPQETPTGGDVEMGMFAYWLNNPPHELGIDPYLAALRDAFGIQTQITPAQYDDFVAKYTANGIVGDDGTLFTDSPYAALDPKWLYTVSNWKIHDTPPTFPTTPQTIDITAKTSGNNIVVAIVGDWGAGNYDSASAPASAVMTGIEGYKPDAIVHLGDVYYSGTPKDMYPHWYDVYFGSDEEATNLLGLWATGVDNSFTLNSNHEMCSAGFGYFPVLSNAPFQKQSGTSYFALTVAGWTILGLDTAYNASYSSMYLNGNINTEQYDWIQSLKLDPGKVIVLSHHNGLTYDGSERPLASDTTYGTTLWAQISSALGGDPAAWYWGHIHDGVAYSYPCPAAPSGTTVNTYARCVGHGSIPYGDASGLQKATGNWTYYANTPDTNHPPRVFNGYVILTIDPSNGNITEQFCDVSPKSTQTAKYGFRSS